MNKPVGGKKYPDWFRFVKPISSLYDSIKSDDLEELSLRISDIIRPSVINPVEVVLCPNCDGIDLINGVCSNCGYGNTETLQTDKVGEVAVFEEMINYFDYAYKVDKVGLRKVAGLPDKKVTYIKFKYGDYNFRLNLLEYSVKDGRIDAKKLLGKFVQKINGSYESRLSGDYEKIGGINRLRLLVINVLREYHQLEKL